MVNTKEVRIQRQKLDPLSLDAVIEWIEQAVARQSPLALVHTVNVDHLRIANHDPEFRFIAQTADLSLADGAPLAWSARIAHGVPVPRVTGQDLFHALAVSRKRSMTVYLLGSSPDVNAAARAELSSDRFPGLNPVGGAAPSRHELLDAHCSRRLVKHINDSRAELLLVTLGAPAQEKWLQEHRYSLACSVGIGLGGTLDVFVGRARRAPEWLQALGLEWLYRLMQEPRRLFRRYLIEDLPVAVSLLTWAAIQRIKSSGKKIRSSCD